MANYFRKSLALLVTILAMTGVSSAGAAAKTTITPKDFANAYGLKTDLEGAIYKLTLPRFVYEGLIQSQKLDLAVFNSNAEIVPFTVREATPIFHVSERPEHRVPFYELPPESQGENAVGPLDVYVKTGESGRVVSVKSGGMSEEIRERRYLLDFSSITADGEAIKRELRLSLPEVRLSGKLSIFESTNLRDWVPLLTDIPLIKLKNEGRQLVSDRIELPRTPRRYVMLRIWDVDLLFELKGVGYSVTVRSGFIREVDAEIGGTSVISRIDPAFAVEYDLLGAFPISKINFVLQEPGFYRVRYFPRPGAKGGWRSRGKMDLSMIKDQDGSVSSNAPAAVDVCEDRYWRVEFEGAFSGVPPKMRISWRVGEVFFLAQGGGPYVVAFGSPLKSLAFQDASFLKDSSAVEAKIGPPVDPSQNFFPSSEGKEAGAGRGLGEKTKWQRYLVWSLLVIGGLLLSAMALKLMYVTTYHKEFLS